jgi:hypothetical protein
VVLFYPCEGDTRLATITRASASCFGEQILRGESLEGEYWDCLTCGRSDWLCCLIMAEVE